MDEAVGALVAGVSEEGPAADAQIEPGDVILEFDGKKIDTMRELPRMVAETAIGKAVDVLVLRKGEEVILQVTLGRLEEAEAADSEVTEDGSEAPAETKDLEALGMILGTLDEAAREEFTIDESVEGVLVREIAPGSAAEEKRVQAGDVIKEVAQEGVATPQDVLDQLEKLKEEGRDFALLLLSNPNGELRFVPVRIED